MDIDLNSILDMQLEAMKDNPPKRPTIRCGAFNAASLKQWIEVAEAAGVPFVPASEISRLNVEQLLQFENSEMPNEAMDRVLEINASIEQGDMLRWDACAPLGVKMHLASGRGDLSLADREDKMIHPGDPRAFDILYEYPDKEIPVFKRPIVKAMLHDGFPVEFRVYIKNGEVKAVSNYYPQMSLPFNSENKGMADKAIEYASAMLSVIGGKYPEQYYVGGSYSDAINVTVDFMVLENGELTFLEGGPGFGFGAHPCCFFNEKDNKLTELDGYMFSMGGEPVLFANESSKKLKI